MRILVIDDEAAQVRSLVRALERAGAVVMGLTEIWELGGLLDSQPFDVVIGDELVVVLAKELAPNSRRCLLTASRSEWTAAQLEYLAVDLVLDKPVDEARLLRALGLVT